MPGFQPGLCARHREHRGPQTQPEPAPSHRPLCTDQREEFLINLPRPAPSVKAGGFRAPSDQGKGKVEPARAPPAPRPSRTGSPRAPLQLSRVPSSSRPRPRAPPPGPAPSPTPPGPAPSPAGPRPQPRPAGLRAPPAARRLAGAAGGSQWARRSAAGAVPGAGRPSPIRAGASQARAVAAGRPRRRRAVRQWRCRGCASPASVDSVGQSRVLASPVVCVTDHTASWEYVAVVQPRCREGKWRLLGVTADGQPAAERPAGLAERRPQPAPCRWLRSASHGAAGVVRPARGLDRQGAPVRSRPSPEPALVSAAGAAPSCAELSDGASGLGVRGRRWGARGVPPSPAAAVGGRCRGAAAVPARSARRSQRRAAVAGLSEGPDAGAQLLPVSA